MLAGRSEFPHQRHPLASSASPARRLQTHKALYKMEGQLHVDWAFVLPFVATNSIAH